MKKELSTSFLSNPLGGKKEKIILTKKVKHECRTNQMGKKQHRALQREKRQ